LDKQIIGLYFRDVEKCPIIFSAYNKQYWKHGNYLKHANWGPMDSVWLLWNSADVWSYRVKLSENFVRIFKKWCCNSCKYVISNYNRPILFSWTFYTIHLSCNHIKKKREKINVYLIFLILLIFYFYFLFSLHTYTKRIEIRDGR